MNRRQHITETTRLNRKFEDKYFKRIKTVIQSQVNDVSEIVKQRGIHAGIGYASTLLATPVVHEVEKLYMEVGLRYARRQHRAFLKQQREARKSFDDIELKGFGFNAEWVSWIKNYLWDFFINTILLKVQETTRTVIIAALQKVINDGLGIDDAVKALSELNLADYQAARIARTEITRAANAGTLAGSETFPYEQTKEWIATHDFRTRGQHKGDHASHIGLDGVIIDSRDKFRDPINGDLLEGPGDPTASAASTINCRCSLGLLAKVDSHGRFIPKKQNVFKDMKPDFTYTKNIL